MAKRSRKIESGGTRRIVNRRARHDYHILEALECGIALTGSEVKSVRNGKVSLAEGFARVEPHTMELWLHNVDIALYENSSTVDDLPKRKRKLLARRNQIKHLFDKTIPKGTTLIPLAMYFNDRGIAKIEIGLVQGKARHDKRQAVQKREADRTIARAMSRKRIG